MPPSLASLSRRWIAAEAAVRREYFVLAITGALHLAALLILGLTEVAVVPKIVFLLTWGIFNFFWLALLRRPAVSAAMSLTLIVLLILVSKLKLDIIWMTVSFVDVMIIDVDAISYLLGIIPGLYVKSIIVLAILVPALALLWWTDPFRVRYRVAAAGLAACIVGLTGISLLWPQEDWEAFFGDSFVSKFSRSGVSAVTGLITTGMLQSDAATTDRLKPMADATCTPARKPPNIILVHDESSFDISVVPNVKLPRDYQKHFRSFDGKQRSFIIEGAGGPSWYTEYNVLSGLSARSFGQFSYFVTKIAANRVHRGLPQSLRRCGYKTLSLYPSLGAFMSARSYQTTTGVQKFFDSAAFGSTSVEPDSFYYDKAAKLIERERGEAPLFVFVYLAANHYPWTYRWRPDLAKDWRDLGNEPRIDEYLRRQSMSAREYADFFARLKRDFPGESFLLVRFGDHQPDFAVEVIEPALSEAEIAQRLHRYDPRYYSTYYAIDTINFKPVNLSSALDRLEGPYLPLVVQEAAGLPLDPSFAEQKKILERCHGVFYECAGGAEARRFNRLLIDAGLIKRL